MRADTDPVPVRHSAHTLEAMRSLQAIAGVTHDMRTLLNGVLGFTTILLDTELSIEQRDYAKRIRESGNALLELLSGVLDYGKAGAGKLELDAQDLDIRRLVEEVGELFAERAAAKGIELVVDLPEEMPARLRGDAGRLRQILVNLVSNAIKFTDRGEVVVRVAYIEPGETKTSIRFEVEDTGPGIAPADRARLFVPYTQLDGGKRAGGTGLGLALARSLARAMGGDLGCSSVEGAGSVFHCELPFEQPARRTRRQIPRMDLHGKRILVVSPNETVRRVASRLVGALDLHAVAVATAARAAELYAVGAAAGHGFDAVIVDREIDGGVEAFAAAIFGARAPQSRLVLLAFPGQPSSAERAVVDVVAAKPLRRGAFHTMLRTLLGAPVEHAPVAARDTAMPPKPRAQAPSPAAAPRVLVVDDNALNRRITAVMIGKRGYQVDEAGDGGAAIEAARSTRYAAVIMDVQMPIVDGFMATAAIRASEDAARRTPIIAMTANTEPGARERCLSAGMDDYLTKPVMIRELEGALSRWCGSSG